MYEYMYRYMRSEYRRPKGAARFGGRKEGFTGERERDAGGEGGVAMYDSNALPHI